jgi:transposase
MPVYSQDLRKRVLDTIERGDGSLRQIALRFLVSLSFVVLLSRHPAQFKEYRAKNEERSPPAFREFTRLSARGERFVGQPGE